MYIKVRTVAGAKKELVEEFSKDTFTVSVKEKAERNQANVRVRELIASQYKLPVSSIRIVSGHHHPIKMLSVNTD